MTDMVQTIFGPIPRQMLDVTDRVIENGRARTIRTEWTLREDFTVEHEGNQRLLEFTYVFQDGRPPMTVQSRKGELVKADAHIVMKTGISGPAEQGFLNS